MLHATGKLLFVNGGDTRNLAKLCGLIGVGACVWRHNNAIVKYCRHSRPSLHVTSPAAAAALPSCKFSLCGQVRPWPLPLVQTTGSLVRWCDDDFGWLSSVSKWISCGWPTFPSVLWCCWLGLLTCKTVSRITYTVLVETLNPAQSNPIQR